jgi:hypothetical protein
MLPLPRSELTYLTAATVATLRERFKNAAAALVGGKLHKVCEYGSTVSEETISDVGSLRLAFYANKSAATPPTVDH